MNIDLRNAIEARLDEMVECIHTFDESEYFDYEECKAVELDICVDDIMDIIRTISGY